MRPEDRLAQVAALASAAAEARLAALRAREQALRERLAALEAARRDRADRAFADDPAVLAGADLRWEGWVEGRAASLRADLARCLAEAEIARGALARAWGRAQAAGDLAAQARIARHRMQRLREDRDS
jgi:hypothetical protein